ncbi:MAG: response regulator transcription factor [Lachnospiraceae bacterium]|nr:response regulator transcription factor [Lachnospiraceae bacterium]
MLQIAICDDETFYREKLKKLLEDYVADRQLSCNIRLFPSGKAFLSEEESRIKYDIVFLDIHMEEVDGLETAQQIRAFHSDTNIVLVTAFIHYVLEGYKVNAVRYILKDTLEAALPECMDAILEKMSLAQVTFSFLEGEKSLYTDNLLYVESRKHKSYFCYMDTELMFYQLYDRLDVVEEKLADYGFLRIHKSYLVNMKHIRKISNYLAFLDTGEELPIPRLKYPHVKEAFVAYKGIL